MAEVLLDPHYIPIDLLEMVFLDKDTGAPLTGGLVYFFSDVQRTTPKPVYQLTGTEGSYSFTQLPNPMTLSAIGTFEDALANPVIPYYLPYTLPGPDDFGDAELYYVVVKSSTGVEQFTRQALPYLAADSTQILDSAFVNELSNPQFSVVNFPTNVSSYTYNFNAASFLYQPIAPNWAVIVSCIGAGSVTVSQTTPLGSLNDITNPGTILNISSTGLTYFRLVQRLYGSPNLWGRGYLSGTFVAKQFNASPATMNLYYTQSNGIPQQLLVAASLSTANLYEEFSFSALIPSSTSNQSFPSAYVDIEFEIPLNFHVEITSVMIAFTGAIQDAGVTYDQTSFDRQVDQLFHYYNPQLQFKPIPSYLVGWDFPLNPAQSGETDGPLSLGAINRSIYAWDQTILFQSVDNSLSYLRNADTGGFSVTTANTTSFALIQYLPNPPTRQILQERIAMALEGYVSTGSGTLAGTITLAFSTLSTVPALPLSCVATINSSGVPTLSAGWDLVPTDNIQTSVAFTLPNATSSFQQFNGWDALSDSTLVSAVNTSTFIAIIISFVPMTSSQAITMNYISLNGGDIGTRPAAQTPDQVLKECQYYYETSYDIGIVPGTASTSTGSYVRNMTTSFIGGDSFNFPTFFTVEYKSLKYADVADLTFYSPVSGDSGKVYAEIFYNGSAIGVSDDATIIGNFDGLNGSQKSIDYKGSTTTALITASGDGGNASNGIISFHWTCDSRLGII